MRILVVDDHAMFAESIRLLLGARHKINTAASGSDALAQITSEMPQVVLLDHNLPDIDGLTLLKVVQALPEPPPVLLLSGSDDVSLVDAARQTGAVGFLHKSLPADALIDAIEKVAAGDSVWPAAGVQDGQDNPDTSVALTPHEVNSRIVRELGITERQIDVLRLLVTGLPNKTIASRLGIAESTVKTHIKSLFHVLKVKNRVACHNRARELGLLQ
ncbi:MAG: response regulator transcription factor [Pseudomonadota bacterium]